MLNAPVCRVGGGRHQDSVERTAIYIVGNPIYGAKELMGGVVKNFLDEGWGWVSPWPFYYEKPCWHRRERRMGELDSSFT